MARKYITVVLPTIRSVYLHPSMRDMSLKVPHTTDAAYIDMWTKKHTQEAGYEVLVDTNNSSADFYEREKQSLHE